MFTFILNPAAGNGQARRWLPRIRRVADRHAWACRFLVPDSPAEVVAAARQSAGESRAVVAVGGDGTVHLVAKGLVESGLRTPLGIVPVGTGNDFVKMLGYPKSARKALEALPAATPRPTDYGIVEWTEGETTGRSVFFNAAGTGFDAAANLEAAGLKHLPGPALAYLVAVLRTLRSWPSPEVAVSYETSDGETHTYSGPLFLLNVGNGRCVGGSFYLTPEARIDDAELDLCLVRGASTRRVLQIIPLALVGGSRIARQPEVQARRIRSARLSSGCGLAIHADGEVLSKAATSVRMEIVPAGLSVLRFDPDS